MKKEFFQILLNGIMFRKLTSALSFLKKEKLDAKDLESAVRELERTGIIDALKQTEQDPKELVEMSLIAFDESVKKARERYAGLLNQMANHLAESKKS